MDNEMNIQTHLDEIRLINNLSKTPKSFNLKNKGTQTSVKVQHFLKFEKDLLDLR